MNVTGLGQGSTLSAAVNLPFVCVCVCVCVCVYERTLIFQLNKKRLRKTAYYVAKF
jgi:hypothetical protein